jgi:hypothetical protein
LAAPDATCICRCHGGCVDRRGVEGVRSCSAVALELVLAHDFCRIKSGDFAAVGTVVVRRASRRALALIYLQAIGSWNQRPIAVDGDVFLHVAGDGWGRLLVNHVRCCSRIADVGSRMCNFADPRMCCVL